MSYSELPGAAASERVGPTTDIDVDRGQCAMGVRFRVAPDRLAAGRPLMDDRRVELAATSAEVLAALAVAAGGVSLVRTRAALDETRAAAAAAMGCLESGLDRLGATLEAAAADYRGTDDALARQIAPPHRG